jgi:hypothetical protein
VLARLFVLLGAAGEQKCTVALDLLQALSRWYHPTAFATSETWNETAGKLREILNGGNFNYSGPS